MGRNLVLMFDGTGNILGNQEDTNVVRLMRVIDKHCGPVDGKPAQLVYYDPGVGSSNEFPSSSTLGLLRQKLYKIGGLALGSGAFEDVAQGYQFLVDHYQDGDRIFLFGFSRGAFTARALGGMVNLYGLAHPMAMSMLPLMVNNYFAVPEETVVGKTSSDKTHFNDDIITNFSLGRRPLVHFVGVWDTVETIGSGLSGGVTITNPPTIDNKRFAHVRHAVSIHETRDKYRPRLYVDPKLTPEEEVHRSFSQHWFAGVHSDVGGSYARDGLSVAPLQWMADAARACGLQLKETNFTANCPDLTLHDESYESPYWIWTGLSARPRSNTDKIDPSSGDIGKAIAATMKARKRPWTNWLGRGLLLLVAVLAIVSMCYTTIACTLPGSPAALGYALLQYLAPWQTHINPVCRPSVIGDPLRWDTLLIFAYCAWLPFPMSWAARRIARPATIAGEAFPKWLLRLKWVMLVLFLVALADHLVAALLTRHDGIDAWDRIGTSYAALLKHWFHRHLDKGAIDAWADIGRALLLILGAVFTTIKVGAGAILAAALVKALLTRAR